MMDLLDPTNKRLSEVAVKSVKEGLRDHRLCALTRLAAMSMAHTDIDTRIVAKVFKQLMEDERIVLIDEL